MKQKASVGAPVVLSLLLIFFELSLADFEKDVIVVVNNDGNCITGDDEFNWISSVCLGVFDFLFLDFARCVRDIHCVIDQCCNTCS